MQPCPAAVFICPDGHVSKSYQVRDRFTPTITSPMATNVRELVCDCLVHRGQPCYKRVTRHPLDTDALRAAYALGGLEAVGACLLGRAS